MAHHIAQSTLRDEQRQIVHGPVADRIVVLRLGRNAAEFKVEEASTQQLVAAITGASDNVVAARAERRKEGTEHG